MNLELARHYAQWLEPAGLLRESAPGGLQMAREIPAHELQARWFAGEFGREFVTTAGELVEIVSFGAWNSEPGPVFAKARLSFRGGPPEEGGIEVRTDPLDWDRLCTPELEGTRLHVFAGGGVGGGRKAMRTVTLAGREVPQVALDVRALEFAPTDEPETAGNPACRAPLAAYAGAAEGGQIAALLEAAAQYRLCRKAARLQRLRDQSGPAEGLYQALAETLGYRHNKLPFTLLAQRYPLALLRRNIGEIEPILFAGSGFLAATDLGAMPEETRGYLREVWELWWPRRTEFEGLALPASLWKLHGARPANHPQRRVAALAEIVRHWPIVETLALRCEVAAIRSFFSRLRHRYWDTHYTLTSRASARRMALVGPARVADMLANVFFPAAVTAAPRLWSAYRELPALDTSSKLEQAARRLFGPDEAGAGAAQAKRLLRRAVYQQGLLQLYEDHCLKDALDCSQCALPHRVLSLN